MPSLLSRPPHSPVEPVIESFHGISVIDPYRWLEDQHSPRTRAWIAEQLGYGRSYLDSLPGRDVIRQRVRELLAVDTYDSLQIVGSRYFFRKRLANQQQSSIRMREGVDGEDQLLVDPAERRTGPFTALKLLRVSPDGNLLFYEVKQDGERTGEFEIFDIASRRTLSDSLPRGYLRGFAFAPDGKSFYYVHEASSANRSGDGAERSSRTAYHHVLGDDPGQDREIFSAGEDPDLKLSMISDGERAGFLVHHLGHRLPHKIHTDFYVQHLGNSDKPASKPSLVLRNCYFAFAPRLLPGRVLALTDYEAPNRRIVEVPAEGGDPSSFRDIVPESEARISTWFANSERLYVEYSHLSITWIAILEIQREKTEKIGEVRSCPYETVRLLGGCREECEFFFETQSFTDPVKIYQYGRHSSQVWARNGTGLDSSLFEETQVRYASKDGTSIPMFLFGRKEVLHGRSPQPTIMTGYGGYGVSMTPQFSVLVALLVERGCLFALPNIRGGSEQGAKWHRAAQREKRQVAYDDFLSAAEWLIDTQRTTPGQLGIFGGSNSGLLVGAALTQRPELFRAALCMAPLADMLRYHLFDNARLWKNEFGCAEDPDDFPALIAYSPYHNVQDVTRYPATMIVSGDADQNCNPMHARKMTARLQAANVSEAPIFLDYSPHRGHSPVLPLDARIDALTDRLAFLCHQLNLTI